MLVPGDPASVSTLGAELVRRADTVREHRDDLARTRASLGWEGPAGHAFGTSVLAQERALDDAAEALAEGGRALQNYAVDLQHARALAGEADGFLRAHGLVLHDDLRVGLPPGVYGVDDARAYEHHVPEGQRLVDRAVAERDEAARVLRLRTQGPTALLQQTPAVVAAAVQVAAGALARR